MAELIGRFWSSPLLWMPSNVTISLCTADGHTQPYDLFCWSFWRAFQPLGTPTKQDTFLQKNETKKYYIPHSLYIESITQTSIWVLSHLTVFWTCQIIISYWLLLIVKFVVEDSLLNASRYNQSITIYAHFIHLRWLRCDIRICYLSHHFACKIIWKCIFL